MKKAKLTYPVDKESKLFYYEMPSQLRVDMKPSEFLKVVVPPLSWYQPSLRFIKKSIKKKTPLDPLFLDVRMNNCQVVGHEGRHRAKVADDLGVEAVPVIIFCRERIITPQGEERDVLTDDGEKCRKCLGILKREGRR